MRKPAFCICENKDADQLRSNREADLSLCFRYTDSTIPLLPKFQASGNLLWLYSLVCVGPGQKPQRQVFSQRGSDDVTLNNYQGEQHNWSFLFLFRQIKFDSLIVAKCDLVHDVESQETIFHLC